LGTKWEIDTHDKILFFEDIDEFPHRIDRYLTQLLLANKLQKASAILFGALSRCEYPPRHEYAGLRVSTLDIIREQVVPLGKPCLYGLPFGHTRDKLTMPNGGYAFVDATNQRVLLDPAVS
jgi:muramoyltetrapeptide carboxypeptidase